MRVRPSPRVLCAALLALLAAALPACRQTDVRTVEVAVPEMHNEACAARVAAALKTLRGVALDRVVCDAQAGRVTVVYDSMMLGLKNIEHAIADAGFTANGLPASDTARAALPPDCRLPTNAPPSAVAP